MQEIMRWNITYYDAGGKSVVISADSSEKAVRCVQIMTGCKVVGTALIGKVPKGVAW